MISREEMEKMSFRYVTWEPYMDNVSSLGRVSPENLPLPHKEKMIQLRIKMKEYHKERFGSYSVAEAKCMISLPLLKGIFSGQRNITRSVLARFCIGMKATVEEADELLSLQGHHFDEDCKLDVILKDSLQDRIDIYEFDRRCREEYDFDIMNPYRQ